MPKEVTQINNTNWNSNHVITINMVSDILDYMEANLLEPLTPDSIAKYFYLSVSTLNNIFKIVCGITIMEYLRNRRLTLAGNELLTSNIHIIDLAYKYCYETPEAFTKAFTRFHGFPPSFVRRTYPILKVFSPLTIQFKILGGWEDIITDHKLTSLTNQDSTEQEGYLLWCYDNTIKSKGGIPVKNESYKYHINLKEMKQKEDWRILLLLSQTLEQHNFKFKVDGKTMIFAHGIEYKLEKICLTFKWWEEEKVKDFFGYDGNAKSTVHGFKYFDVMFEGMKVRCMFYGDCPGDDTDEFLYRNTEPINIDGQIIQVQTLEFYYENGDPNDVYYKLVEQWLKQR